MWHAQGEMCSQGEEDHMEEGGGQITWRTGGGYRGEEGGNTSNKGGTQMGPRKDPNAMDIDRGRGGDRMCYICGKWGHMAKNCWERYKGRIVETLHESEKKVEDSKLSAGLQ